MQREVEEVKGNVRAIGDPEWARHILNVRFRVEKIDLFTQDSFAENNDQWLKNRHRYQLYDFKSGDVARVEGLLRKRRGDQNAPIIRPIFRRGSRALEYTPEHQKMQAKLLDELQKTFGHDCVTLEEDFVDAIVRTDKEITLYEIKTDLEPRTTIRNAMGQVLEYAYHPFRKHNLPLRLVIVGRCPLTAEDEMYLKILKERFFLPLEYKVISI
jgi:hypothetical protein